MDFTFTSIIGFSLAAFYLWRDKKKEEKAVIAIEQIRRDNILYRHIRSGVRECEWKIGNDIDIYYDMHDKEVILENAHLVIYYLEHFAEFRLGFYFKDIKEYGLYCDYNDYKRYYRTDSSFEKEEFLVYDDEASDE